MFTSLPGDTGRQRKKNDVLSDFHTLILYGLCPGVSHRLSGRSFTVAVARQHSRLALFSQADLVQNTHEDSKL